MDRMATWLRAAAALTTLALVPPAGAAESPIPSFPSSTELVEIDVVVTDAKGVSVRDLRQQDFVLREDGQPQTISHFTLRTTHKAAAADQGASVSVPDAPARTEVEVRPRHLVLAVDDLHLAPLHVLSAKNMLADFIDGKLEPGDEVAVITTSGQLGFLEQFTTDKAALRRAIARLGVNDRSELQTPDKPELSLYHADLIERNDSQALQAAVREVLREDPALPATLATALVQGKARTLVAQAAHSARVSLTSLESIMGRLQAMDGRKTLVLLSDGFYMGSGEHFDLRAITGAATRAGVVIYAIDARGLESRSRAVDASVGGMDPTMEMDRYRRMGFEADRDGLNALALDTGGLPLFNLDLEHGLQRVLDDTAVYYRLAYAPSTSARDGRFRKLDVRVPSRRGLDVRTHRGYFAPGGAETGRADKTAKTRRAAADGAAQAQRESVNPRLMEGLKSPVPRRDLPLEVGAGFIDTEDGPAALVTLEVDVAGLRFAQLDGVRRTAIELAGLFVDESGKAVASFDDRREFRLDAAAFERAAREGLSFTTQTPLAAGLYQVRVAVLEGDDRLGTATRWVEVPDLARKQFAASDLFLSADGELRPLRDGQRLDRARGTIDFALFTYNAKADAEVLTDVLFATQIQSGSKTVVTENPFNIVVPVGDPPQPRVAFSRRLTLTGLEPGEYTLGVLMTDRIAHTSLERRVRVLVE